LIKYSFITNHRGLILLLLFTLIFMQLSCQTNPSNKETNLESKTQTDNVNIEKDKQYPKKQQKVKVQAKNNNIPNTQLTEKILFKYILGELAIQHKDYETAFNSFMSLSETTKDPRIAKYALRIALMLGNDENILKAVQFWSQLEQSGLALNDNSAFIDITQMETVILLKVKQDDLAIQSLLDTFKLMDSEQAMSSIGVILSTLNDYSRVKNIFSALNAAYKNNYYVNLYSAKFALRFNDYQQAEKNINTALQIESKDETAYLLKSTLYKKMGQVDKAIIVYKQAIDILDKSSLIRLEYAKTLLEKNQRQAVIEQLEQIVNENSNDNHILYSIGMLAMDIKEYDQARIFFTKLYHLQGFKDQGAFLLGVLAYSEEKNDHALDWFEKIKGKKYEYESLLRKAIILSEQKHYNKAIDVLENYITTDRNKQLNLLRLKADVLNQAEKYNKAYDTYSDALYLHPTNIELLYGRAMVAEKQGRIDLSEKDLLSIIKVDPKNSNAFNALGFILAEKTTRYHDAQMYIEKALQLKPNDMAILDSMGWVLYKLGKLQESLNYLKQAYDIEQDPEIAAHYGEVLWVSGQQMQAKQIWQSSLLKHPQHVILKSTISTYLKY
jgi:tetratricopeptide (TPR) repeat protein